MIANIARQPNAVISAVTTGPATAVPSVDEQFHMPVAVPREARANQSRVTRALAGDTGASPKPSPMRATKNTPIPVAAPPQASATDQSTRPPESMRRGPTRSTSAPAGSCAKA